MKFRATVAPLLGIPVSAARSFREWMRTAEFDTAYEVGYTPEPTSP